MKVERITLGFDLGDICLWPLKYVAGFDVHPWGGNGIFEEGFDYKSIYLWFLFVNLKISLRRHNGKNPDNLDEV